MHPYAFYSMGISDRRTSIALTWNAMTLRQRNTDRSRNSFTHTTRTRRSSNLSPLRALSLNTGRSQCPAPSLSPFGLWLPHVYSRSVSPRRSWCIRIGVSRSNEKPGNRPGAR